MCKLVVYLHQFVFLLCVMPGQHCVVRGDKEKDPDSSFYRFTSDPECKCWLQLLEITEAQLDRHSRVCSRHIFQLETTAQINLGKRFVSPIKQKLPRAKRVKARNSRREASIINSAPNDVTPLLVLRDTTPIQPSLTAATGEQFCIEYSVHELPNENGLSDVQSTSALPSDISLLIETVSTAEAGASNTEVLVNKALLATVEVLVKQIQNDDDLFRFYTGFISCFS